VEEDESWFHRFVQPHTYAWSDRLHPVKLIQQAFKRTTPDKALACFGALCQESQEILLDFADGYPNSEQMWWVIVRLLRQAKQLGKRVMVLIWDNASWHTSKRIRQWIRTYNRQAKQTGDVRLLVFWLPKRSPWLNPIEPYWGHTKRRVCEPSGDLPVAELRRRIRAQFKALTLDELFQLSAPI
jgi:transposase